LFGWIGPWDEHLDYNEIPSVIHGQIGTTPITLFDLVPGDQTRSWKEAPHHTRIAVNTAIGGIHALATPRFKGAAVRLLHLNEWANRDPWASSFVEGEKWQQVFSFTDPGTLTARLPNAKASLTRGLGWMEDPASLTVTSDERVSFVFDSPLDLETIGHDYVRPLQSLVELAAVDRSSTLELTVVPEGSDEYPSSVSVLSAAAREKVTSTKQWFEFLFTLRQVNFTALLPAWWQLHSEIGVVCDLLGAVRERGFVGNQFLIAASAIEGYHRHRFSRPKASPEHKARVNAIVAAAPEVEREWLSQRLRFSHEPTFAERIDDVIDRGGPLFAAAVGQPDAWRDWVKRGRDSVAHRDPGMFDVDKEWRTTIRITATIQWLMTLVLLCDLQIPDEVIATGVRQQRGLRLATDLLREVQPDWFN
jgi:hypothetical protein